MNARGGCCIARYSTAAAGGGGGGGGGISYGISKVEKIMLKFRPIAPKPVAAGSGSSCSTSDGYGGTGRRKRKYVRSKGKQTKKDAITTVSKKQKVSVPLSSSNSGDGGDHEVVTLSLMPETPDRKEKKSPARSEIPDLLLSPMPLIGCNNKLQTVSVSGGHVQGAGGHVVSVTDDDHAIVMNMTSPSPSRVISFVTVECVTETWMNGGELGFAEEPVAAAAMKMEMDTCPAFITDGEDVVVWTNRAYREMTASGGGGVVVVMKKNNRLTTMPAFTCKVKVTWGTETESRSPPSTLTAPCDVWRLQGGGYAWRLDVKAALFLGR